MMMEILCCIAWFNPFFHLIKKEIKAIHEFLADEYAISDNNRYDYAELLVLRMPSQQNTPAITHPFFHNQIKRRITMITQSNLIRRSGYISRIMALPLLFLLVSAFAVKLHSKAPEPVFHYVQTNRLLLLLIRDMAEHLQAPGMKMACWKKILRWPLHKRYWRLSKEYNVNIVLTRNNDALVGNASNLKEDLQNRVTLTANAKADLFVSIHVNATEEKSSLRSGFDAYISGRNAHTGDRELASALLTSLKEIYAVNDAVQESQAGIVVLDKSACPAVCLECGYITNAEDVLFISNPSNQEKLQEKF